MPISRPSPNYFLLMYKIAKFLIGAIGFSIDATYIQDASIPNWAEKMRERDKKERKR